MPFIFQYGSNTDANRFKERLGDIEDRGRAQTIDEYDIAFDAKAGQVVSHTFKADKTCSCDIEWERTSHPLGTLVVSP